MQWMKTEWYLFVIAAFAMSLIYYVALDNNVKTIGGVGTSILGKVMGQNSQGVFQKPF
jgi:hypothetical protein